MEPEDQDSPGKWPMASETQGQPVQGEGDCSSPLLDLPPELQIEIYGYAVTEPQSISVTSVGFQEPPLLTTCKQISAMARQLFFAENTFALDITDYDMGPSNKWERIVSRAGEQGEAPPIRKIKRQTTVRSMNPNWANLLKWLKAFHGKRAMMRLYNEGSMQRHLVSSMFSMVTIMREQRWNVIKAVLKEQRRLLAKCDAGWNDD